MKLDSYSLKNMKITILKPDHLGDLVLSIPAINKILEIGQEINLFCNPDTFFLAKFLFPNIKLFPISFPHLAKNQFSDDLDFFFKEANESDLVVILRSDKIIHEIVSKNVFKPIFSTEVSLEIHETLLQKKGIEKLTGNYECESYFYRYNFLPKPIPKEISKIGLVISAGFFNNSLPLIKWVEYAKFFMRHYKAKITNIAGPAEISDAKILSQIIKNSNVVLGGQNVDEFLKLIRDLDLLIATDSGTAHIASISGVPILSLFGASPYKRYKPFGPFNRVVCLEFTCSPCPQFEILRVNKCITKECLVSIQANNLLKELASLF